jgi:hypothetical protein
MALILTVEPQEKETTRHQDTRAASWRSPAAYV